MLHDLQALRRQILETRDRELLNDPAAKKPFIVMLDETSYPLLYGAVTHSSFVKYLEGASQHTEIQTVPLEGSGALNKNPNPSTSVYLIMIVPYGAKWLIIWGCPDLAGSLFRWTGCEIPMEPTGDYTEGLEILD
jgi:hypothetical protein